MAEQNNAGLVKVKQEDTMDTMESSAPSETQGKPVSSNIKPNTTMSDQKDDAKEEENRDNTATPNKKNDAKKGDSTTVPNEKSFVKKEDSTTASKRKSVVKKEDITTVSNRKSAAKEEEDGDDEDAMDYFQTQVQPKFAVFGPDNPTFLGDATITLPVTVCFTQLAKNAKADTKTKAGAKVTKPFVHTAKTSNVPDKTKTYDDRGVVELMKAAFDPANGQLQKSELRKYNNNFDNKDNVKQHIPNGQPAFVTDDANENFYLCGAGLFALWGSQGQKATSLTGTHAGFTTIQEVRNNERAPLMLVQIPAAPDNIQSAKALIGLPAELFTMFKLSSARGKRKRTESSTATPAPTPRKRKVASEITQSIETATNDDGGARNANGEEDILEGIETHSNNANITQEDTAHADQSVEHTEMQSGSAKITQDDTAHAHQSVEHIEMQTGTAHITQDDTAHADQSVEHTEMQTGTAHITQDDNVVAQSTIKMETGSATLLPDTTAHAVEHPEITEYVTENQHDSTGLKDRDTFQAGDATSREGINAHVLKDHAFQASDATPGGNTNMRDATANDTAMS